MPWFYTQFVCVNPLVKATLESDGHTDWDSVWRQEIMWVRVVGIIFPILFLGLEREISTPIDMAYVN